MQTFFSKIYFKNKFKRKKKKNSKKSFGAQNIQVIKV